MKPIPEPAAQLILIRETVRDIVIPNYVENQQPATSKPLLFRETPDETLLGYGVPQEWLEDVRAANEDSLLELAEHLPQETAEALLELATGGTPQPTPAAPAGSDPFVHPDAQRRFRVMSNVEELERALDYPWDKWTIFLHPAQRQFVERELNGPARVSGSAGTGKTIVALHRAVFLARRRPEARVLLTTFSSALANALRNKLKRLIGNEPRLAERLEVHSLDEIGQRLYNARFGVPRLISSETLMQFLRQAVAATNEPHGCSLRFLLDEWEQTVDAWNLGSWEAYRTVRRLGRKTRLPESRRAVLWSIFQRLGDKIRESGQLSISGLFHHLAAELEQSASLPFEYVVVDEAQDLSVAQLRFLAALGGGRPDSLFFAGDLGQRIFRQPFSWKALGVDIRGRSRTLRINYRTSHQIRMQADRLLAQELGDVDGNSESRRGTVSVFNGPRPEILLCDDPDEEIAAVGNWLSGCLEAGIAAQAVGLFVRSSRELGRARKAVEAAGIPYKILDERMESVSGHLSISSMHLAKGLEFRAVAVMACDDDVIPSQERIEAIGDDADLEEVYTTERHLLYVACTRARDRLLISGIEPASEFLDDLA